MAQLKAENTHYTLVITSLTKVHICILFALLFPIRTSYPLHVNHLWQPQPESQGLSALPRCWAICGCYIWICSVNYMDFLWMQTGRARGVPVHQPGQKSKREVGEVDLVSGSRRVNRECVRQGEWTQTSMIAEHAVSYGVGKGQGDEERAREDGNTTALSPNSGFPAAWINILYSEQNVSRSGSALSSVNSYKLGKLCRLLPWHL